MPRVGWDTVTVPGAVSAWVELSSRFGRLPFEHLFEPAIAYARDGFLVAPITARAWSNASEVYAGFEEFRKHFLPQGRAPRAGERFRYEEQACTLEHIAKTRGEAFYTVIWPVQWRVPLAIRGDSYRRRISPHIASTGWGPVDRVR